MNKIVDFKKKKGTILQKQNHRFLEKSKRFTRIKLYKYGEKSTFYMNKVVNFQGKKAKMFTRTKLSFFLKSEVIQI